ncbi:MAG TPA: DUF6461 domain-containing protein [Ktedonosporobacter sp.]|nr:DUF6461 domain-containing protein [Ktedonosporobacter sp.]
MLDGLLWIAKMFESYDWCYCVTFARGLDKPEMLRRFGADPSQAVLLPFQDERLWETFGTSGDSDGRRVDLEDISPFVQVGYCDGWAFAIESVSAEGTRPEVLRAVSVGTVVVSVCYVGAKALALFSYAEDGVLVAQFDPLVDLPYGDDPSGVLPYGDDPMRLLPVIRQVDIEREDYVETMFELAEKIGVHLPREVVAETLLLSAGVVPLLPPSPE